MVEYITGINGVGKTRIMCEACINTAAESKGNVIFIDVSDKLSTRLPSNIRLINVSDFGIEGATALCGFLVGLCASDYDLTDVFVDSTIDIINNKLKVEFYGEYATKLIGYRGETLNSLQILLFLRACLSI